MNGPWDFTLGAFAGIAGTVILLVLMTLVQRTDQERRCMNRHKAPACVLDAQWVPVFKRAE